MTRAGLAAMMLFAASLVDFLGDGFVYDYYLMSAWIVYGLGKD